MTMTSDDGCINNWAICNCVSVSWLVGVHVMGALIVLRFLYVPEDGGNFQHVGLNVCVHFDFARGRAFALV